MMESERERLTDRNKQQRLMSVIQSSKLNFKRRRRGGGGGGERQLLYHIVGDSRVKRRRRNGSMKIATILHLLRMTF